MLRCYWLHYHWIHDCHINAPNVRIALNSNLHFKYVCLWLHYGQLKEKSGKQIQAYTKLVFVLKLATIRISKHSAFDLWFWILSVFETFLIKKYCYSNNTLCGKISFSDGNLKQEVCRIRISNPSCLLDAWPYESFFCENDWYWNYDLMARTSKQVQIPVIFDNEKQL